MAKAFKDCNIAKPISAYALRRNFIQSAQKVADDKKVAAIAGHQVQSVVQHTKYGNRFDTLDVVDMINEGSLKDVQTKNKYIEGILSVSKIYKRLSGEEYYEYIGRHLTEEQKLLNEYRKRLKEEYGSVDNAVENQKELEGLSEVYKKFKNKQDMLRRKAMKAVSESRRVEALKKMTIAEEEDEDEEVEIVNISTDNEQASITEQSPGDDRLRAILSFGKPNKTLLTGRKNCFLCLEMGKNTSFEGHSMHITHLFKSLISKSWPGIKKGTTGGQHAATNKYMEENKPTNNLDHSICSLCKKEFNNKVHKRSSLVHLKKKIW